jgi:hypothetical protein
MRAKRRRLEAGFKAKVGLEALKGIKTVAQIARDEVDPIFKPGAAESQV